MARTAFNIAATIGTIAFLGGLGGCQTAYVADIRNDCPQPVIAQLYKAGGAGNSERIGEEKYIGPGDRASVAKYGVPTDWPIYLQVDTKMNPGYPQQFNLTPGTTIFTVSQEGNDPKGKLRLDGIPWP